MPASLPTASWRPACLRADLVAGSGVVALVDGRQVAIFHVPDHPEQPVYALSNKDPQSGANVIGRGILAHLAGELVVASPMYKQHFRLRDGQCVEDATQALRAWPARLEGDEVWVLMD
ncbi:nitrite reductase (NAD(P)H) small subunit [Achromobacter aloeverae]|uniref:Nitrite reductase (NAD(P)H) small subunit n=1 Tax=Achromobacter aloeverae TaxID=1750518 RepID=A0A4Q1HMB3_9BURK|nr:nitrite reductase small subunit NirD [Achromobacter aloeverae]RXN90658.1 nitrite reductase (NAD(P)H) small subunit [Achromobacter aloeverae]